MKYQIKNQPIHDAEGVAYDVGDVVSDPPEHIVRAFGDNLERVDDSEAEEEEEIIPEGGESFSEEDIQEAGYRELKRIMGKTDAVKLKNPKKEELRNALLEHYGDS